MTETATPAAAPLGMFARMVGMVTSPKATFQDIVANPRPFGILFVMALVIGIGSAVPMFTEAGQNAVLDMQMRAAESGGQTLTPEQRARFDTFKPFMAPFTIVTTVIMIPIITLFMTALYWAAFNVVLGGSASFKQVLSTVSHSQVIPALGILAGIPFMLNQPTMSMAGPFNLGALMPWLEAGSRLAKFMGNLGVFGLWGVLVNAIGLGVLYRRKTVGIFIALLIIYLGFVYLGSMFR